MTDTPNWWMKGDLFDVCSCHINCPCGLAQAPTNNHCEGVMAYRIREGVYGDVNIDGLTVIAVVVFDGYAWAKESKVSLGILIDERANDGQREALQKVFSGQAGGWMGNFSGKSEAIAVDTRLCPFRSWADRSRKHIPFDWTGPKFG